jgi:hypothetical protein
MENYRLYTCRYRAIPDRGGSARDLLIMSASYVPEPRLIALPALAV